jgi:hypothetical protein
MLINCQPICKNQEKSLLKMLYFIHADLDAFYASVKQLDHSEYRGKPVIVGGLPDDGRSIVSTARSTSLTLITSRWNRITSVFTYKNAAANKNNLCILELVSQSVILELALALSPHNGLRKCIFKRLQFQRKLCFRNLTFWNCLTLSMVNFYLVRQRGKTRFYEVQQACPQQGRGVFEAGKVCLEVGGKGGDILFVKGQVLPHEEALGAFIAEDRFA